ncbi:MAG: DUF6537 domain-containing protein, partial [Planctomycetota bacterium]|jgi:hypothetical protein
VELNEMTVARLGLLRHEPLLGDDLASACRAWFHTDRVTDLALLGAAFQLGLIPVTLDSVETAIEQVESHGFGRSLDAFRFGRRFAVDPRPAARRPPDRQEPLDRLGRRIVLSIRGGQRRGLAAARRFGALLRRSLSAMPGLTETDRGRQARRDFVHALQRCFVWGGQEYAQRYADLVTRLYRVDRGDTGRALTRNIVLPLAEVMLIRDPIFVAAMATSAEQRRRTRQRLDVKHARGDRIVRRFLTRVEVTWLGRSMRLDFKSGEWIARRLASIRHAVPTAWRGGRTRRALRSYVEDFVARASEHSTEAYEQWNTMARRLHDLARDGRLTEVTADEVRALIEPPPSESAETVPGTVET